MLASKASLLSVSFPAAVTPKIDGIRCIIKDGEALSRTLKPIRNKNIQEALKGLPDGLDGELVSMSNNFQDSTTAVMAADSEIPWKYVIFDYVTDSKKPYSHRVNELVELQERGLLTSQCEVLKPEYLYAISDLRELHAKHIAEGFEGTMVRIPDGRYKFGRSTEREGLLLKLKEFSDTEAVVVGFEELMHNENEQTTDALGHAQRSSHKENKRASGMLGAFVVHPLGEPELIYNVGTGLTQEQRQEIWNNRQEHLGKIIKVKYFSQGVKRLPRHPVFIGFRHEDDL